MESFQGIIDHFGEGRIAEALGVAASHVRTMRARNSIPPEYWGKLAALDEDLSYELLVKLREERFLPQRHPGERCA